MGQRRAKARLIVEQWGAAGLDAAALGQWDWSLGSEFVFDIVAQHNYPVTAANLVCGTGQRPFPAARIFERGGRRIAVVGLTVGAVADCVVTDPQEAAEQALELVAAENPDVTVLLWPDREEMARLGASVVGFDFVVDASGRHAKPNEPLFVGQGWVLGSGLQTKSVGVLQLEFEAGEVDGFFPAGYAGVVDRDVQNTQKMLGYAQKRLEDETRVGWVATHEKQIAAYEVKLAHLEQSRRAVQGVHHHLSLSEVKLTDDVADHALTAERVASVKASFSELSDETPAAILSRPMRAPKGSAYAGAEACIQCHAPQYNQWRGTRHSRAMLGLLNVDRHMDDTCFSCHVTGAAPAEAAGFEVVLTSPAEVGGLLNVQCEACHGPAAAHAADPGVKPVRSPGEATCRACHTVEQDEGRFDFGVYLPRVSHPTDP